MRPLAAITGKIGSKNSCGAYRTADRCFGLFPRGWRSRFRGLLRQQMDAAFVLSKENRRVPFAAYRSVFSSPRSTVDMLANRTSGLAIICSIAAHVGPCVSVQLAVAYHPSASATEYGYRADRPRDRAHQGPDPPTCVRLLYSEDFFHSNLAWG